MTSDLYRPRNVVIITCMILVVWLFFVLRVDTDIVLADQFPLILDYEKLRSGDLSFAELWAAKGGHRFPGYKLLFYLNCFLFGFSAKLEIMVAALIYGVTAAIVSLKMTDALVFRKSTKWFILAALILLWFNGQTLRVSAYSLIAMQLANIAAFVFMAYWATALMRAANTPPVKSWVFFIAVSLALFLFFGRGYGMAAAAALMAILMIDWVARRRQGPGLGSGSVHSRHWGIILCLGLIMAIYMFGVSGEQTAMESQMKLDGLMRFVTAKIGHAYIGLIGTDISKISVLAKLVTIAVLSLSLVITLNVFRRPHRSNADMVAMFLIYFSAFSICLVSIGRHDQSPFFQRHNLEIAMGAIGLTYFCFQFMAGLGSDKIKNSTAQLMSVCLILLLARNLMVNLKAADVLKADIDRKEQLQQQVYGGHGPVLEKADYKAMGCNLPPKYCQKAFEIMQENSIGRPE